MNDITPAPARPMQRLALGLLGLAAALYAAARAVEPAHPAFGFLRAFCEAALVGGLADWFAVTALFRRPLALPIPHTAIIPANKDRLGEALGNFVESNFLSPEVIAARLADVDFSRMLAAWLADPARSGPVAERLAAWLPHLLDALEAQPMRRFIHARVSEALDRMDVATLAAEALEALATEERMQALVDELLEQAERFLREAEPDIRARVREKTAWLWQKLGVDEKIADRLIEAAEQALAEVSSDPTHAWRQRFEQLVREQVEAFRHNPSAQERARRWQQAILSHPLLGELLGSLWDELRAYVRADALLPDSHLRSGLQHSLRRLGEALLSDSAVCDALNQWVRSTLTELVRLRRNRVAALISDTVRGWDARTVSDRIERAIGRDLQYIRINGTLIGGLVGVLLHAVSLVLPW